MASRGPASRGAGTEVTGGGDGGRAGWGRRSLDAGTEVPRRRDGGPAQPGRRSRAAGIALASVALVALARVLQRLPLHISLDYNEGWHAYHSAAAVSGGVLYPPPDSWFSNNYPPLSFYLVGLAGRAAGDTIVAGRLLSVAAFLILTWLIYTIAGTLGANRAARAVAALWFAASMLLFTHYVGIDDPQLAGHAISVAAIPLVFRERRSAGTLMAAALLLSLGVFTKHNLIALPLAIVGWLAVSDRRAALVLTAAGLACAAVGLAACAAAYGLDFFRQMLDLRAYSTVRAARTVWAWLAVGGVPLVLAAIAFARARLDPPALFCAVYLAVAIAVGGVLGGGADVDANIMFDATIALAFMTAIALTRRPSIPALMYVVPLAVWMLVSAERSWLSLNPDSAAADDSAQAIALLRGQPAPVWCQALALCFWAGQPPGPDTFALAQRYRRAPADEHELATRLDGRAFSAIQLNQRDAWPFSASSRASLERGYRIVRDDRAGVVRVPR